jgi:steroid delta-isomerase
MRGWRSVSDVPELHDADAISSVIERIHHVFSTLQLDTVRQDVASIYSQDAFFKDPFNEVSGINAIQHIFEHMFEQVSAPRFVIHKVIAQDSQVVMLWDFCFVMKRWRKTPQRIHGSSHLTLDESGLIVYHRDYWDIAEELYSKLPVLGALMRWLQRQARR